MKHSKMIVTVLLLALCLSACGAAAPAATPVPEVTAAPGATAAPEATAPAGMTSTLPGSSAAAAPASTEAPAAEETPAEDPAITAAREAAKALIGEDVAKLYEAIGEPVSADYASSCLAPNSEDGELTYDGFTVYTLRNAEGETVYDVE